VREQPGRDQSTRDHPGTVGGDHPVLEVRPHWQHVVLPVGDRDLEPDQRREHVGRRPLAEVLTDDDRYRGCAVADHRQVAVVREARLGEPVLLRQRDPQLQAVQDGGPPRRGFLRVRDAPPGGHQVQLAGPDQLPAAEAVPVQYQALEQPAHGLQADVRVRRHLHAGADADVIGSVVVQEAPRADSAQGRLRQQPADLGAVAHNGLARLKHVDGTVYTRGQHNGLRRRIQIAHSLIVPSRSRRRDPTSAWRATRFTSPRNVSDIR
jgi:hypothetical protein